MTPPPVGTARTAETTAAPARPTMRDRLLRIAREVLLLGVLYVAYSASRLVASDAIAPALQRALDLVHVERLLGLHWELTLNQVFVEVQVLGLLGSYWYATAHYVVTAGVLVWLFRRGPEAYLPARRALVVATLIGLTFYLTLPTAPPRFLGGYVDVLQLHSADGWWGADASAPRGLGQLTNQLAAFPSLHAGWALWVAIVVQRHARHRVSRWLGWLHALVTAVVIIGTGNHWVIDALLGWLVVLAGFVIADRLTGAAALDWARSLLRRRRPATRDVDA